MTNEHTTNHTPKTWYVATGTNHIYIRASNERYVARLNDDGQAIADAAFIVQACNSHDGLLAALKDLLGSFDLVPDAQETCECLHCGRKYPIEDEKIKDYCPSDDCPGFKARAAIESATKEG